MKELHYLSKNGKITLIAPSFGCTTEPYKTRLIHAIKNLKNKGFEVNEGENIYLNKGNARSNTAKKCAEEFMQAYESDAELILSVGGGETMCEILPFVDFEKIKSLPHKFFVGFSDNTNLIYPLTTISETPALYAPCAGSYAFYPFKNDVKDSLALVMGKTKKIKGYSKWEKNADYDQSIQNPLKKPLYDTKKIIKLFPNSNNVLIRGRMIGGCLDCLGILCGTRFDKTSAFLEKYKKDGFIWFLEACDLNPISIERVLFQLKEAGWFKYVKGFIFGRPLHFDEEIFGIDRFSAVKNILKNLNVPIIFDADLGHFNPTMPIITGVVADVEVKKNNIYITYR